MAHRVKVVHSYGSPCGLRCVDITAEPEGGFGWSSYRRDPEDTFGWRADGLGDTGFDSVPAAIEGARSCIGWMGDAQ